MEMLNDNQIKIYDDEGNEYIFNILFTYENKERNAEYAFIYNPETPDDIIVMRYNEEGELFEVTNQEELDEADEVLAAYEEDPKINNIK